MLKIKIKLLRFLVFGFGLLLLGSGNVYAQAVSVSLPALTVQAGTSGTIPLTVGDLTGKNVTAFQFTINYDKNVLYLTGASTTGLTMTGGTDPVYNADTANGKLVVAWARATAISGSGTLINLSAQYRAAGTSALAFGSGASAFMFNAGTPAASVTNGSAFVPSVMVNFVNVTGVGLNDTVLIPISTQTITTAQNVLAFNFVATYDKNIINVIDAVTTGTLSAGGTVVSNPNNTTGSVSVAWAHSTKITGSGTLVYLRAKVVGRGTSALAFTSFQYNAGTPTASGLSGSLISANRKPNMTAVTAKTVAEAALLSFSVSATDPDGDVLTYSFTSSPAATGAAMTTAGAFTWTPGYDQAGTYTVTYKVTDGSLTDSSVSTITVTNVNRKPVFNAVAAQSAIAGNAYSLVVEAVDPDGDALTYSYVGTPPSGSVFTAATRTFAWTPTAAQVGAYTLKFRAADAGGLADTLTVALTVTKTNRPPVFVNQLPDTSTNTNVPFAFQYLASDPDLDLLRFYLISPISGAKIDSLTGIFTWTPTSSQSGVYDVVVLVSDGELSTNSRVSKLTVVYVNRAPALAAITPKTVAENVLLTFTAVGTDIDGDVLTYSLPGTPTTGASINASTGVFSWTPSYDQAGAYNVTVRVTDTGGLFAETVVAITVTNVNRAPSLAAITPQTVAENVLLTFTAVGTDPDGDVLTYGLSGTPPAGASINASTGVFSWTPTYDQAGAYNVTVTATDAGGLFAETIVAITVTNVNRKPVITAITAKTVAAASLLTFTASATDPDGDAVTYSLVSPPAGASINGTTGVFTWTPDYAQVGSYNVQVRATDAGGLYDSTLVAITVSATNRKPIIVAVTAKTVAEGALLSFTVTGTDPDGDALTFSFTSSPAATGAVMTTAGAFTWTPGYDQAGTYNVTYRVTDGSLSDSSVSTITVTNVNRKPVFNAVAAQAAQAGNAYSLVVEAVDPDGDALTYSYVGTPPSGSVFTAATRTFAWTPTAAQVGAYTLKFRAADAGGLADTLSVGLTVTKTNRPPVFVNQLPDGSLQTHVAFSFTYTATDPDLDVIGYYLVNPPAGAAIHPVTGVFTWTPVKSQIGTHDIVVVISDGVLSTTSRISKLTVTLFNNAPTWLAGGVPADTTIKENQTYTFRYRATDVNPGDVLKYAYIVRPTGAVIDSVTGIITWTPTYAQGRTAPYTNIVSVTDGYATIRDTSFITVQNVNQKPVFTQVLRDTMVIYNKLFSFKFIANDPDLDPIYYFIVSGPAGATINNLGTFFWTPTNAQRGVWWDVVVGVRDYADTVKTSSRIAAVATSVEDEGKVPEEYKLFQNYPNPFNPSTAIKYGIPKEGMVSLKIFNSIGEEIVTVVSGIQQAGYYKYEIDASKLNSGIYFYRLQAGDFVSIKKMMYLK